MVKIAHKENTEINQADTLVVITKRKREVQKKAISLFRKIEQAHRSAGNVKINFKENIL